jgi:hypothetical protein
MPIFSSILWYDLFASLTLINKYKEEENKSQDEFKFIKRTLKKKPSLNSFHFKYYCIYI